MPNSIYICLFIIFAIYLYNTTSEYFFFYLYLMFTYFWIILSSSYIETGVYLIQTNMEGYYTGATKRLILLTITFFIGMGSILARVHKKNKKNICYLIRDNDKKKSNKNNYRLWVNITFILSIYCLIKVLFLSTLPFVSYINNFFVCFAFVLGIIYWDSYEINDKKIQRKILLTLIIIILYRFLNGITFTANLLTLISFGIPILSNIKMRKIKIFTMKNIMIVGLIFTILISMKLTDFTGNSNAYSGINNTSTPLGKLIYRAFALQGEVWWDIDSLFADRNEIDFNQIKQEFESLFDDEEKLDAGIYYLMNILRPNYYSREAANNFTLNSGYPAILISIFGYGFITYFITFFNGIILALIIIYLMNKLNRREIFCCFFAYGILTDLYVAYIMGGLYYFSTKKMLLCVLGVLLYELILKKRKKLI